MIFWNFVHILIMCGTSFFEFRKMKASHWKNHVVVQIDFAKIYGCQCLEAIQTVYWNPKIVTLHPTKIYCDALGKLQHRSLMFVSEVLSHNFSMVFRYYRNWLGWLKRYMYAGVSWIFITGWTHQNAVSQPVVPLIQFRTLQVCLAVKFHDCWHYFESGHGKGACDGIGGMAKSMVDTAIKTESVQNANDLCLGSFNSEPDYQYLLYIFINKDEYNTSDAIIKSQQQYLTQ